MTIITKPMAIMENKEITFEGMRLQALMSSANQTFGNVLFRKRVFFANIKIVKLLLLLLQSLQRFCY